MQIMGLSESLFILILAMDEISTLTPAICLGLSVSSGLLASKEWRDSVTFLLHLTQGQKASQFAPVLW